MAQPVYSTQFITAHAGAVVGYVCPVGYRAVVRCITGFNANAITSEHVQLLHEPSGCTVWQKDLGPQVSEDGDLRFVFNAGEVIHAIPDADCDMTVSGQLLTLP